MTAPAGLPLACPGCARRHGDEERFCVRCGLPLVRAEGPTESVPATEAQERARKVRKQYAEGPLVRVAYARHQAEAEMISGLLLDAGVPSLTRRSGGFDVPDMLAAGPRDVLVPASGVEVAHEALGTTPPEHGTAPVPRPPRTASMRRLRRRRTRLIAGVAVAGVALAGIAPLVSWLSQSL